MATTAETEADTEIDNESHHLALSAKQLQLVRELLKQNLPDYQAWAFGSRATGHARRYSDLDIAIIHAHAHDQALPFHKLCQLSSAFEESELDICVDIVDWHQASPEFRRTVEQSGMVRIR